MKEKVILTKMSLVKTYGPHAPFVLEQQGFIKELERKGKEHAKFEQLKDLPEVKEYQDLQRKQFEVSLEDLFEGAKGDIEELQSEIEDWAGNLEGSSLANTQKCQDVKITADTLSGLNWPEMEEWPKVMTTSYPDRSHRTGRAHRASVAASRLEEVAEGLESYVESQTALHDIEQTRADELQEFADGCRDVQSEVEHVDFPGMY